MGAYSPIKILGPETGLVTDKEKFLIPNDGYVELENMYLRHGVLKRKLIPSLLARLRRAIVAQAEANTDASPDDTYDIADILSLVRGTEPNAELIPGTVILTIDAAGTPITLTDNELGGWVKTGAGPYDINTATSTINYSTGVIHIEWTTIPDNKTVSSDYAYHPALPVMGLNQRELDSINNEQTIAFDQKYAYRINAGIWQELPSSTPTTWSGSDSNFFWSTNWFNDTTINEKIFWVTNFSGSTGDPIRYYNSVTWNDLYKTTAPVRAKLDTTANFLFSSRILIPFRGRLVALNTIEGDPTGTLNPFTNRIRYSQIGNPFQEESWRDDIIGKGGFLDIPTTEDIISAGFVRDNLVIYCERSTWQLRYTGQSIAPFQIEKVNTELGATSSFASVSFDTELVTIGGRGIITCDSFKAARIDDKIESFVFFNINNDTSGPQRVQGIRDFAEKLAYWTYPNADTNARFPDRRLVLNYEEHSWAILKDSYTTLGYFYSTSDRTWASMVGTTWDQANWPWGSIQSQFPTVVGGNQQGFVMNLTDPVGVNQSLAISAINGAVTPIQLTIVNHNLQDNELIKVSGIPAGTAFATTLNNVVFGVEVVDANTLQLFKYNSLVDLFNDPIPAEAGTFVGYGRATPVDNIRAVSKKFNMIENGQKIQLGYVDVLTTKTSDGEITFRVYADYADADPTNSGADAFFNSAMSTAESFDDIPTQSKTWHRVYCPVRANMIQTEWTMSNSQLNSAAQKSAIEIDAQILWVRNAGRLTT